MFGNILFNCSYKQDFRFYKNKENTKNSVSAK